LQNLMIDTGWGQIPVVDPHSGEIIGIATRTDLIQTLAPVPVLPGVENLASRLEAALPPARLALIKAVAAEAGRQRAALYLVGGFVRDLLLDQPGSDFDLVVEGDAVRLAYRLAQSFGGRVTSHVRFGTAKWHLQAVRDEVAAGLKPLAESTGLPGLDPDDLPAALDLVTARTEFYSHPTALPTVERGSIKLDLHRRDFTINTLAVRLDGAHYGELNDYWGGLSDLRQGLVRVLHSLSFVDDPTRMLRAVRFEKRFDFKIERRTLELLGEALPLLARVSGDRIRHELDYILEEGQASAMLRRLDDLELLAAVHADLAGDEWFYRQIEELPPQEPGPEWGIAGGIRSTPWRRALAYALWTLRLEQDMIRQAARRLKFSAGLLDACLAAGALRADLPALVGLPPSQVVLRLDGVASLALYANFLAAGDAPIRSLLESYVKTWSKITSRTSGDDLRAMGIPPGPAYRKMLAALRAAWLDGKVKSPEEEIEILGKLLAEEKPGAA
jgi:tRNA nucleotidyltransferase (CCA-adding enzyme)